MIINAKELLQKVKDHLTPFYPLDQIQSTAQYYICERFDIGLTDIAIDAVREVDPKTLQTDLARLAKFEPIQHIIGSVDFGDLRLKVSSDVLIPRPETEELVHLVIDAIQDLNKPHILDLCTGSGCIPLLLKQLRNDAEVDALEISKPALDLARANGKANQLSVNWIEADICTYRVPSGTNFQVIVSNPPYVLQEEAKQMSKQVLDFEPSMALFAPEKDPLFFFRKIIEVSESQEDDVLIFCEINESLGSDVASLFRSKGYSKTAILIDLQGKDRFVSAQR